MESLVDLSTPCKIWTRSRSKKGYGQRRVGRRILYVHRLAWEAERGPIPKGLTIDHLCRVKACWNVFHMELVTREENSRRGSPRKKRCHRGHQKRVYGGAWSCPTCRADRYRERRLASVS